MGEINKAIVQLESVTQENATQVQAAAASSASFQEEAHRLTEVVSRFRMAGEAGQPARRGSAVVTPKPRLARRPLARQLEQPVDSEWKEF